MNGCTGGGRIITASFLEMLNAACARLWERKIALSIRRIEEFDARLRAMERELDQFLAGAGYAK
ncbi:MAG: hypothetical protein LBD37_01395 [Treponema sp.]|jgi:hypothetical protein|nr:hypothetical protein [Treponema sp.]